MKEVIDLAANSEFSKFSKKVKQSLEDKLRDHPSVKDMSTKKTNFEQMKDQFSKIADITNPTEPEAVDNEEEVSAEEPTETVSDEVETTDVDTEETETDTESD